MDILDAYQAVLDAEESMHAGKQNQITKDDLMDSTIYIVELHRFLQEYEGNKSILSFVLERLFSAVNTAKEIDKEVLPANVKEFIVLALMQTKKTLADIIYAKYKDTEIAEDDIDLFTDVICTVRGIR